MIVKDNSPLRRLSNEMNDKKRLFLDGIRYCIEMTDLVFGRLEKTLYELTRESIISKSDHYLFVSAIQDAWSMVDFVHRLRGLIRRCPGIKQKLPEIKNFFISTESVEILRNFIQHLDNEINNIITEGLPILGALTWITIFQTDNRSYYYSFLIAGTMFNQEHHFFNPSGKTINSSIDHVILTTGGHSICLSKIFNRIKKLTTAIENEIANEIKEEDAGGSDLIVSLEISGNNNKEGLNIPLPSDQDLIFSVEVKKKIIE